jgi:acetyltransferase-like isoleucine patch superfamily enzyme
VRIGERGVFGAGVRLNPHVIVPRKRGNMELWVAPVELGREVLVGGYSLLLAGTVVADGEVIPPREMLRPYRRWRHGRVEEFST